MHFARALAAGKGREALLHMTPSRMMRQSPVSDPGMNRSHRVNPQKGQLEGRTGDRLISMKRRIAPATPHDKPCKRARLYPPYHRLHTTREIPMHRAPRSGRLTNLRSFFVSQQAERIAGKIA